MLETLAKATPLPDEVAIRAAMHLARDHGKGEMRKAIVELASKRDDLRGVVAAALWDLGESELACKVAHDAEASRSVTSMTWGTLVSAASSGKAVSPLVLCEPTFRRVQWGWVE